MNKYVVHTIRSSRPFKRKQIIKQTKKRIFPALILLHSRPPLDRLRWTSLATPLAASTVGRGKEDTIRHFPGGRRSERMRRGVGVGGGLTRVPVGEISSGKRARRRLHFVVVGGSHSPSSLNPRDFYQGGTWGRDQEMHQKCSLLTFLQFPDFSPYALFFSPTSHISPSHKLPSDWIFWEEEESGNGKAAFSRTVFPSIFFPTSSISMGLPL